MFAFVAKHRGIWPTARICEALGVSRSGFYAWLTRGPSARSRRDEVLGAKIRSSFQDSDRTYGARRVWHDLLAAGLKCGLHAIERLMRRNGLRARPRRRRLPTDLGDRSAAGAFGKPARPPLRGTGAQSQNGWPTSPTCGQPRAGCTWPPCSTSSRAEWSVGR
jgi:transposase InsO family protein